MDYKSAKWAFGENFNKFNSNIWMERDFFFFFCFVFAQSWLRFILRQHRITLRKTTTKNHTLNKMQPKKKLLKYIQPTNNNNIKNYYMIVIVRNRPSESFLFIVCSNLSINFFLSFGNVQSFIMHVIPFWLVFFSVCHWRWIWFRL